MQIRTMANETSSAEVVQRLFLEHAAALRGFILGLAGDPEAAKDIFQEVFVTVNQRAEQFRMEGNFLAWARGVARNKVLEHYRKCNRLPQLFDENLLDIMIASAGKHDDIWEQRRAALAECIKELAPRARQILELRYAELPATPPEIARRLAWTVDAVHVALSRARKFLQDCTRRRLAAIEG